MAKNIVKIVNKTGNPADTKIVVNGQQLPINNVMGVDIEMRPHGIFATVEIKTDLVDITGEKVHIKKV